MHMSMHERGEMQHGEQRIGVKLVATSSLIKNLSFPQM